MAGTFHGRDPPWLRSVEGWLAVSSLATFGSDGQPRHRPPQCESFSRAMRQRPCAASTRRASECCCNGGGESSSGGDGGGAVVYRVADMPVAELGVHEGHGMGGMGDRLVGAGVGGRMGGVMVGVCGGFVGCEIARRARGVDSIVGVLVGRCSEAGDGFGGGVDTVQKALSGVCGRVGGLVDGLVGGTNDLWTYGRQTSRTHQRRIGWFTAVPVSQIVNSGSPARPP